MIAEKMKGMVANSSAIRAKKVTDWQRYTGQRTFLISALAIRMCRLRKQ